ncbi:MAG: dihydrolipoyl dehydrogenase [Bradymonadaceae bacterium]
MSDYDVVVIGSGPGGYVAAIKASQNGLDAAIVERESTERLGGTCLLRGCIPTKAMLQTATLADKMRHSEDFGITSSGTEVDMEKMDAYREKNIEKNSRGVQYLMKKNEIDVHWGHGCIAGPNEVSVEKEDGSEEVLTTDNCVLATGSKCSQLPFIETDGERILDSDQLLESTDKPDHMIVLGAGAVGSEYASCYLRYGSDITLVEMMDRVVPGEDKEVSAELEKSFERQGMNVRTAAKVTDVSRTDDGVEAVIEDVEGGDSEVVDASHFLIAVGRDPVTEDVGLGPTGVELTDTGHVEVDEYMRTDEDWIYAIGDIVADSPWLAHTASHEGILAVDDIADADPHPIDYDNNPMCTYCSPEVASVGLTEREAEERGYDVQTGKFPFSANGKATIVGQDEGFVKIVSETKYDEFLGLHIIGPKATELITEGTTAMKLESTVLETEHTIHPHPTLSEAVGEAAHAVLGETLHA